MLPILQFVSCDSKGIGATSMSVSGSRLVVARLSGAVDLYTVHVANASMYSVHVANASNDVTLPHHTAAASRATLTAERSSPQSGDTGRGALGSSHSAIDLSRSYSSDVTAMCVEGPALPWGASTAGDGGAVIGSTNGRDVSSASLSAGGASAVSCEGTYRRTSTTTAANNFKSSSIIVGCFIWLYACAQLREEIILITDNVCF